MKNFDNFGTYMYKQEQQTPSMDYTVKKTKNKTKQKQKQQDGKAKQLYFKSPRHLVKQFILVYIIMIMIITKKEF